MATFTKYAKSLLAQYNGNAVDFDTDTIKAILLKTTHTPNTSATGHEFLSDIIADQVATGTAYTGPIALTTVSLTLSGTTVTFDADDLVIAKDASTGFTDNRYVVIFKDTGTAATSRLIAIGNHGADLGNTLGTLTIAFDATGIFDVQ